MFLEQCFEFIDFAVYWNTFNVNINYDRYWFLNLANRYRLDKEFYLSHFVMGWVRSSTFKVFIWRWRWNSWYSWYCWYFFWNNEWTIITMHRCFKTSSLFSGKPKRWSTHIGYITFRLLYQQIHRNIPRIPVYQINNHLWNNLT